MLQSKEADESLITAEEARNQTQALEVGMGVVARESSRKVTFRLRWVTQRPVQARRGGGVVPLVHAGRPILEAAGHKKAVRKALQSFN